MKERYLIVLIASMILYLAIFSYGISLITTPYIGKGLKLDSYATSDVYRTDGTVDHYDSNYFGPVKKGDRIQITIPLPAESRIQPAVIFFSVYQCEVELSYKGTVLYEYGESKARKNKAIGNVLVSATIPDEAWGDSLVLDCKVVDHCDFSKLSDINVCEAKNSLRYLIQGKIHSYLLSAMILIIFSALFFVLLFWRKGGVIRLQGMYLSAFCVGLMIWQMGYDRMFYIWSDNVRVCGMAEYLGIFFAPAPFCMFLYYAEKNKLFKKAMVVLASAFTLLFFVATVLNFTSNEWHYCRLLRIDHILIGITALVIVAEFIFVRTKGDNKKLLIRFGIVLYVIFTLSDLLKFYLDTTGTSNISNGLLTVTSLGMYIFLTLMLISYILHVLEHVISIRDKEKLEKMAYQDALTNAPNRQSCLDYIVSLDNKKDYTVFFFDVNNLKFANDQFGHDMGDKLISTVADLIGSIFREEGFYGRYGGDEFIAVVEYSDKESIGTIENCLKEKLDKINESKEFPFTVQFSYGVAESSEGKDADEIVRLADKRMYERKWLMKQNAAKENE